MVSVMTTTAPMSVIRFSRNRVLLAATALMTGMSASHAADIGAQYGITLAGLQIGKASLTGAISGSSYTINVSSALTGLAGAVSGGRGAATAKGNVAGRNVLTNGFSFSASNGSSQRTIQIAAASGSVRNVVIEPPFEPGAAGDRIPLRDSHKIGVLDPVSALIMPSRTADALDKSNCERRIPVFDGAQRFDVVLSYAGTRQVKSENGGYSGTVLVCQARYVPVAGHRPDRRVTKFMEANRNMDAWLAPVNGGKLLVPYRISVKTMIGTTVIEATSFNPG
jgi:hypothetical protein